MTVHELLYPAISQYQQLLTEAVTKTTSKTETVKLLEKAQAIYQLIEDEQRLDLT